MEKHSTMTTERASKLEELGFIWNSHTAAWEERLTELQSFKSTHGHCKVPTTYTEFPQLSAWVQAQRRQFKLKCQGMSSTLNSERIQKLATVGFDWEARKRTVV
jgi:Helicase associated domain